MQEKINLFLMELRELCEKHGLEISPRYASDMRLTDSEGNVVASDVSFDDYTYYFEEPVKKVEAPKKPTTSISIGLEGAGAMLHEFYVSEIKRALDEPHRFEKWVKKENE